MAAMAKMKAKMKRKREMASIIGRSIENNGESEKRRKKKAKQNYAISLAHSEMAKIMAAKASGSRKRGEMAK